MLLLCFTDLWAISREWPMKKWPLRRMPPVYCSLLIVVDRWEWLSVRSPQPDWPLTCCSWPPGRPASSSSRHHFCWAHLQWRKGNRRLVSEWWQSIIKYRLCTQKQLQNGHKKIALNCHNRIKIQIIQFENLIKLFGMPRSTAPFLNRQLLPRLSCRRVLRFWILWMLDELKQKQICKLGSSHFDKYLF